MADQGLYQTQTQKLAIGPQMQQSLQILQAPTLELRQIIQQEIEINPVLELESPEVSLEDAVPDDPDSREDRDELDVLSQMDEEWREYWAQSRAQTSSRTSEDQERWQFLMDSIVRAHDPPGASHLPAPHRRSTQEPEVVKLTEFLIGSLDDAAS
jgi:RNA polymerase sigma-54 factor